MIKSFADKETRNFWETGRGGKRLPANLRTSIQRKLQMLDAAKTLDDLKQPPNNRLHALEHDRAGQHAIRVNDQFRVCFTWNDGEAYDVEITDYH
ncbi:MAG TPA: type II toxin-antitoxin system RelE/ParE family toxin [Terriglobales bacterium]|jgi:proteic killer suppression protein|nr:type II toxin-antitoxin system RelE/ParE family toxin [Terriglobales bacterium]